MLLESSGPGFLLSCWLAIVKHIVRLHGSEVQPEREQGIGTTFSFALPRASYHVVA